MTAYAIAAILFVLSILILAFANIPGLGWAVGAGALGALGYAMCHDESIIGIQ